MNDQNKDHEMPCDPASTRRSLVPGPESEKLATEGGGGVGLQAPPPATVTGTIMDVTAATSSSEQHPTGPVPKRKPKRKKRNAAKRAAESSGGGAAASTNTGDAVLDKNTGRSAVVSLTPTGTAPAGKIPLSGVERRKALRKERRRTDAALVNEIKRRQLEGSLYPPNVSAIAPSVGMIMARPIANDGGTRLPATEQRSDPNSLLHAMETDSVGSIGGTLQGDTHRSNTQNTGTDQKTPTKPGMGGMATGTKPDVGNPETFSEPQPVKGKGKGKGRSGRGPGDDPVANPTASGTSTSGCNRNAKRQRSSDFVSPSSAKAEKKVRLGGSSPAMDAEEVADQQPKISGPEEGMSYARASGSHLRVVILDKSGVHMDDIRATILRKKLEEETVTYFLQNCKNWECAKPTFVAMPRPAHGGLRVEAEDDFSLSWLTSTISNLPVLWSGSGGLKVMRESALPKYHKGVVIVPDFEGDGELIRTFLAFFNSRLRINTWPIFAHRIQRDDNTTNNVMVFGIPVDEIEILKTTKYRLKYKMATVYVLIRQARTGDVKIPIVAPAPGEPCTGSGESGAGVTVEDPNSEIGEGEFSQDEIDLLLSDAGGEIAGSISCLNLLSPAPPLDVDESVSSGESSTLDHPQRDSQ